MSTALSYFKNRTLDDVPCCCPCECPWTNVRVQAVWSMDVDCTDPEHCGLPGDEDPLSYTATAAGSVDKTLALDDCAGSEMYGESGGSGSLAITTECSITDNSGPLDVTLVSVGFSWDCRTRRGMVVISVRYDPQDPGEVSGQSQSFEVPIIGNGPYSVEISDSAPKAACPTYAMTADMTVTLTFP